MIRQVKALLWRLIGMRGGADYIREMLRNGDCHTGLDIGCGFSSVLTPFRPELRTVGLDAFPAALEQARQRQMHDDYVLADIRQTPAREILEKCGGQRFDLVTLIDVIEHLPKRQGFDLLEKCEELTCKYILIHTPNGFLPQGPEGGNEYQRHLSGWFPHDFEGLGYQVHGAFGTKLLRGYAGRPKYDFPGAIKLDWVLAWLLRAEKRPCRAFSLMAVKNVRGVPAKLGA